MLMVFSTIVENSLVLGVAESLKLILWLRENYVCSVPSLSDLGGL